MPRASRPRCASTGIDYESTLSTCPRRTIATADGAFAALARQYGLNDLVVGARGRPSSHRGGERGRAGQGGRADDRLLRAVRVRPPPSRPWRSAAHVKVRTLDPLSGPPAGGWPRQADYVQLMEANLGALSAALGCPDTETGM